MAEFSDRYGRLRMLRAERVGEDRLVPGEDAVQCIWYDRLYRGDDLRLDDGRSLTVISPGWWNHGEGPDFKGAQLEINGRLRTCDVEIHLAHAGWRQHGHHDDRRYDGVGVNVVLDTLPPVSPPLTSSGKPVPTLLLGNYLEESAGAIAERLQLDDYPYRVEGSHGYCAALAEAQQADRLIELIRLAGEWRLLFKADVLRDRMERLGVDQALYEAVLSACGYQRFKTEFQSVARHLPYERARQLAREDSQLLEAAYFAITGLLPEPNAENDPPHLLRLDELRRTRLDGLKPLPLEWKRVGVRPNNGPERRLAGIARFVARTAARGMADTLEDIWREDLTPAKRRAAFETLFPSPMGFWARQCTWRGKAMARANALIGSGRVRSIVGNVFVPAALALARQRRDRRREETVFAFLESLPAEPENTIQKIMLPRLFGRAGFPKIDFRIQQGLLQIHRDWCEPNPSCRNCRVIAQFGEIRGEEPAVPVSRPSGQT